MAKWNINRNGPQWLMDAIGRIYGYRDQRGGEYAVPQVAGVWGEAESVSDPVSGGGGAANATNYGIRAWCLGNVGGSSSAASIFLVGTFLNNGTDQGTEHVAMELGDFTEVQLIFGNNTNEPLRIAGARAIAPADFSDKAQDAAFASASAFTFNGGCPSIILPPNNLGYPLTYVVTDPLRLASVERTDIPGADSLLYVRTLFDLPNGNTSFLPAWDQAGGEWTTGKRQVWGSGSHGNRLTSALTSAPTATKRRVLLGVRYLSPHRVMTVMATGTSLTCNNYNVSPNRQPWGWLGDAAANASTRTRPIEYINAGMSAQSSTQYNAAFQKFAQDLPFTHCLIEGCSVNDISPSVADSTINLNFYNVMKIAEAAQKLYGAKVGIWSGYPSDGDGSGGDTRRLAYLAKLAALSGFDYLDVNSVLGDTASPQRFQSIYSDDNVHPNTLGTTTVTPYFTAFFQAWANQYFGG